MDWERTELCDGVAPSSGGAGAANGEDLSSVNAEIDFSISPAGRRPPGRKISHRKNPSDTFAFAAGQLFQTTPEDFYNLLDVPLEYTSVSHGLQHATSADKAPVSPQTSLGGSVQQQHQQQQGFQTPGEGSVVATGLSNQAAQAALTIRANYFQQGDTAAAAPASEHHLPGAAADAAAAFDLEADQQMPLDDEDYDDHEQQEHTQHSKSHRKQQQSAGQTRANALDPSTLEPRRAKRILANRQSAQRSRMKRLQYIHDLENRSAATAATVKELQGEVERLQQQHAGLAETMEARKAQVESLSHQLLQQQTLKAKLLSHIKALKAQSPWQQQVQQQQQQQQPWSHAGQQQQLPIKQESPQQQQQQQQQPKHQLQQHQSLQEGYLPHHHPGSLQAQQQQQQQQPFSEKQPSSAQAYLPSLSQPPVSQMNAMDLSYTGTAPPPLHVQQQQLPQQQQQPQFSQVLHGVPLHSADQQQQQQHQQQQADQPMWPNSSYKIPPGGLDPAAAGRSVVDMDQKPLPASAAAAVELQHQQQDSCHPPPAVTAGPAAAPAPGGDPPPFNHHSSSSTAVPVGLDRTVSPAKPLDLPDSPLNLGLAASLAGALPDVSEGDMAGLLQEQAYLTGGLSSAFSGSLGMGSGAFGVGSGGLGLTPSIELPCNTGEVLACGALGSSGVGAAASGSDYYLGRSGDVMGAGSSAVDMHLRKTLSM